MRRKLVLIVSMIATVAVVSVLALVPSLYYPRSDAQSASTPIAPTDQCMKADPANKYPLILEMWNSAGEPVIRGWIILHDPDLGRPFEEGYSSQNGTYRTKYSYSPLQNMTVIIYDYVIFENYVITIFIPDIVCRDGYIHVQVRAE